jgi:hypothetical protein
MRTAKQIAIYLAAVIWLASCASVSKARLSHLQYIRPGQTADEVKDRIGAPESKSATGTYELWHYDLLSDDSSKTYPYRVLFENGRVKSIDAVQAKATDRELCLKRKNSNQTVFPVVGANGAPEMKTQPCGE